MYLLPSELRDSLSSPVWRNKYVKRKYVKTVSIKKSNETMASPTRRILRHGHIFLMSKCAESCLNSLSHVSNRSPKIGRVGLLGSLEWTTWTPSGIASIGIFGLKSFLLGLISSVLEKRWVFRAGTSPDLLLARLIPRIEIFSGFSRRDRGCSMRGRTPTLLLWVPGRLTTAWDIIHFT